MVQPLFEPVNTTGKKLKSSDLIKSYIFFFAHEEMTLLSKSDINYVEPEIKEVKLSSGRPLYSDLSQWYRHRISVFHSEHT